MDDLISRHDAIRAYCEHQCGKGMIRGECGCDDCGTIFDDIPSAQPEQPSEIQDILDYLDTALHPIISPEHWNVYSELHDMISTLPSAQHEPTRLRLDHELSKEEYERLKKDCAEQPIILLPKESAQQWIPCSERLPVDDDYRESMECLDGCVWYFTNKGSMGLGHYYYSTKEWFTLRDLKPDGKVIAWMPLPETYKGEES